MLTAHRFLRFDKIYENPPDAEGGCPIFLCLPPAFGAFRPVKRRFLYFR